MKNLFKKGAIAAAVAGSLMVSGVASADSVLAPLVIGLNDGPQTYFSLKVRGAGTANARMASSSDLHYVWFKKGSTLAHLADLNRACTVSNNNGRTSPWDMVFQRAVGSAAVSTGSASTNMNLLGSPNPATAALDASTPNGYTAGDFVGFVTITDKANVNTNPAVKDLANEGEMSGFGYVVDAANSFVLDYKLLNNHRSKVEGDFSAGFISKKSIDFSWMPTSIATTEWLTVVTGEDMLKADSGSGKYDATVLFSQQTLAGSVSPQMPTGGVGFSGAYNNDEKVTSGGVEFKVTCMGAYGRGTILDELQSADTTNGGWKRMSIQNATTTGAAVATTQVASGAITYKAELINFRSTATGGQAVAELSFSGTPNMSDKGVVNGSVVDTTSVGWSVFGHNDVSNGTGGTLNYTSILGNGLVTEAYDVGSTAGTPHPVAGKAVVSFQVETSGHLSSTPEAHPNRPY